MFFFIYGVRAENKFEISENYAGTRRGENFVAMKLYPPVKLCIDYFSDF